MGLLTVVVVFEFWDSKKGFAISDYEEKHMGLIHYGRAWPPGIWYKGTTTVTFYYR